MKAKTIANNLTLNKSNKTYLIRQSSTNRTFKINIKCRKIFKQLQKKVLYKLEIKVQIQNKLIKKILQIPKMKFRKIL